MSLQIICAAPPGVLPDTWFMAWQLYVIVIEIRMEMAMQNGHGHGHGHGPGLGRENVNENGDGNGNGDGDGLGLVAVLCACNKFLVWNNLRINCLTFPTKKNNNKIKPKRSPTMYVCSCVRQTKAIAQVEPKTNFGFVSSCLAPPHTLTTHTPHTHTWPSHATEDNYW